MAVSKVRVPGGGSDPHHAHDGGGEAVADGPASVYPSASDHGDRRRQIPGAGHAFWRDHADRLPVPADPAPVRADQPALRLSVDPRVFPARLCGPGDRAVLLGTVGKSGDRGGPRLWNTADPFPDEHHRKDGPVHGGRVPGGLSGPDRGAVDRDLRKAEKSAAVSSDLDPGVAGSRRGLLCGPDQAGGELSAFSVILLPERAPDGLLRGDP